MRIGMRSLSLVLLLSFAGCDGFTHIKGKVTDTTGKPIQGAEVELKTTSGGRDDKVKTSTDGSFSVGFSHAPWKVDLALTVSKDGYKTFEKRLTSEDAKQFPATIALEAMQSAGRSR